MTWRLWLLGEQDDCSQEMAPCAVAQSWSCALEAGSNDFWLLCPVAHVNMQDAKTGIVFPSSVGSGFRKEQNYNWWAPDRTSRRCPSTQASFSCFFTGSAAHSPLGDGRMHRQPLSRHQSAISSMSKLPRSCVQSQRVLRGMHESALHARH